MSTSFGPTLCFRAKAAAVPTASPIAMHVGMTRIVESATASMLMHLPLK